MKKAKNQFNQKFKNITKCMNLSVNEVANFADVDNCLALNPLWISWW